MTLAIKFTGVRGAARWGAGRIPAVGERVVEPRGARSCEYGFHAARPETLSQWFGPEAYLVRFDGESDHSEDKLCAAAMVVVRRLSWTPQDSADYAKACSTRAAYAAAAYAAAAARHAAAAAADAYADAYAAAANAYAAAANAYAAAAADDAARHAARHAASAAAAAADAYAAAAAADAYAAADADARAAADADARAAADADARAAADADARAAAERRWQSEWILNRLGLTPEEMEEVCSCSALTPESAGSPANARP